MTWSISFSLREKRLDCGRELGQAPSCVLTESAPLPDVVRYPAGAIGAIEVVKTSHSKGGSDWDVMILDSRGAERTLVSYGAEADAQALVARARTFLNDASAPRFSFVTSHSWWSLAPFFAFGLGISLLLLWHGFRDAGHVLVDVDRLHRELRVQRRLFGISHGPQASYSLGQLRDIELAYGGVRDALAPRGAIPETGARLMGVRHSGHRFPIIQVFLPGPQLFEHGLELLRSELGFATPQDGPQERDASEDLGARAEIPAPKATFADRVRASIATATSEHARAWLWCGAAALLAMTISAVNAWRSVKTEGQLQLRAEYRCQFQGLEILPGGVMSMSLPPGPYQVRVFDTAAAGGWQTQNFQLRAGESMHVVCRPR